MSTNFASVTIHSRASWFRRNSYVVGLSSCFVSVAFATLLIDVFTQGGTTMGGSQIWIANGLLLAYLLLAPRWHWSAFLCAGGVAQIVSGMLIDGRFVPTNQFMVVLNLVEVSIAALLLRRQSTDLPRFTESDYLIRFVGYAVLVGPITAGALFAASFWFLKHFPLGQSFFNWVVADGLGIAVATPAFVAILRTRFQASNHWKQRSIYPAFLILVSFLSFAQTRFHIAFLIFPLLVLTLLRIGLGWAMVSLLGVSVVSGVLTHRGSGPLAAMYSTSFIDPEMMLQLYVASAMAILYSVSVVLERQKRTELELQEIVALHHLVTENSNDVIIVSDFKGSRSYVSSASEAMTGWKPEEVMRQEIFDIVNPCHIATVTDALQALSEGSKSEIIEIQILKKDGNYLWVESNLRVVSHAGTGVPTKIVNVVRDITARKHADQQLQEAYNTVEALAVTDALTGLANRRRFDQYLTSEWRRSMREHTPMSLLMIDADCFKLYNDTYGHARGDSVLRQIAEAAQDVVTRPGDLVARFGGEEFAVVLPNTENEGAMQVANEICVALSSRGLPHSGNPHGIMTISVGCATMVPSFGQHAVHLIELADQALYEAKRSGRNQACNGNKDDLDNPLSGSSLEGQDIVLSEKS